MSSPPTALPVPILCPCCSQPVPTEFRCQACGGPFQPIKAGQLYCSRQCSKAWHRKIATCRDISKPYLRKPRSPEALEAARLQRQQKQEAMFHIEETVITASPPAPDNTIDDYFAQIMAEAEADERADGLDEIELPGPEDPAFKTGSSPEEPSFKEGSFPVLPSTGPTWSPPRRLGQRNAKQARLHAAGIFST